MPISAKLAFRIVAVWLVLGTAWGAFADTTAYVASSGGDKMLKIVDGSESVTTLTVSDGPYGVAVTPDGTLVLATQEVGDTLVIIYTSSFTGIAKTLGVGNSPRGVAIEPEGKYAYVANFDDDTVSKVYISNRTVSATIDVGDGPMGVAARYDEENGTPIVYVTNYYNDTVTVIGEDNEVIKTIYVDDDPVGLAVTPDGKTVYVANYGDDTVSIIDTEDESVTDTLNVGNGPWGVAVGAEGDYVFVTNYLSDTVTVIQTSDNTIYDTVSVGDGPRGVSAPCNGNFAYVVNHGDGSVSRIDLDDDAVDEYVAGQLEDAYSMGTFIGDTQPDAPTGLEAEAEDDDTITLTWTDNSDDELGFKIERSREDEDSYSQIATVSADTVSYENKNLSSNTAYYYRVRAYKEASHSDYCTSATATTDANSGSVWCFIDTIWTEASSFFH